MSSNPYQVVKDFESALCEYTGAKYAVTVTSCTTALLLAVKWHLRIPPMPDGRSNPIRVPEEIEIPKHTYVGVPMSIVHAGGRPVFEDLDWEAGYQLKPFPVWDYARWFTSGMFDHITASEVLMRKASFPLMNYSKMLCVSFHHSKTLGLSAHGGAILHNNDEADEWFRRARFDGRKEGVSPKDDTFPMLGYHAYMTPATAAEGLMRLAVLPKHNDPLPWGPGTNSDYADLSTLEIFK